MGGDGTDLVGSFVGDSVGPVVEASLRSVAVSFDVGQQFDGWGDLRNDGLVLLEPKAGATVTGGLQPGAGATP